MRADMFTRRQAAEYLGKSVSWLAAIGPQGPVITRIGGKVVYLQADLDAYIAQCREVTCHSSENPALSSGGRASTYAAKSTSSARGKQIGAELRKLRHAFVERQKRPAKSDQVA